MLFFTYDLALSCISLKYINYERINLLVCGIKKKRAQVLKVLFLLTTKEEVEAALAAAFKSKMYEIQELLSNELRSRRCLVSTDSPLISFVFNNHLYKMELSRSWGVSSEYKDFSSSHDIADMDDTATAKHVQS